MSFRASLKNLIRRDAAASLRERAADLQVDLSRVARQPVEPAAPAADPAPDFADQVAQAGPDHDVLAGGGIDHRDGTVSYADASGKVSRRPMAHWIGFNALQMHNRVRSEIGRRRVFEANHLPGDEHVAWEARVRRELRSDAVHALAFRHDRAFEAAQAIRTGIEPATQALREQADAELLALAPVWEEAVDLYQRLSDEESLIGETASEAGWPGPAPAGAGPEWRAWFRQKEDWRERSGVASAEEAAGEAGTALHKIEIQIAELPAASLAGLKLKARVGQRSDDIGVEWPEGLSEGLARDLLAFGADGLANENSAGDALLLQLGRQFEAARKRETAACDACNAAQEEANRHMPERPAALLFRASDHSLRLGKFLTHPDHLEGTEVTADDIAWMKRKPYVREVRRPVRPEDNLPVDAHTVVETYPWPEAQERADEIVTAWEPWRAERNRVQDEYVTPALDDAANQAGELATDLALRIAELPARTVAGFRVKLRALACYNPSFFYINPPDLPDADQALSHSLWRDVRDEAAPAIEREEVSTPGAEPVPDPIGTSLVGQIDFASGSMEDLRALWDSANSVGDAAYAMAWTGRCHTGPAGEQHNAAGKLMQWLGEALADVADEARKEAQRRRPETPNDRETRLTILAGPTIENGDPDEIAAFAGEMLAHAAAELTGR